MNIPYLDAYCGALSLFAGTGAAPRGSAEKTAPQGWGAVFTVSVQFSST